MNDETKGKKVETQMRMEEKMEVIAQFAGNLAHDFNNHLFVSLGYLDLIKENPETTEQVRLDAEECKKAGERSARLTRQLLSFGRRQLFQYEVLNLNSIIEESETTLRQLIKKNVEFFLNLDPTAGRVRTDPGQLKQAIMNLVANANEAMPEGGELFIETANLQVPEDLVAGENPCLAPGAYVVLTIRDSGCGVAFAGGILPSGQYIGSAKI